MHEPVKNKSGCFHFGKYHEGGKLMKIVVTFKNGSVKKFNCDTWNFSDISNNNVWLINEGDVTVHLNWVEVLSIEKLR